MKRRSSEQIIFDTMEVLKWGMIHFDGLRPSAGIEKKYVLKLVDLGYAEFIVFAQKCDVDGFLIENNVEKEAWRLTIKGAERLRELRKIDEG